jgi:integrase
LQLENHDSSDGKRVWLQNGEPQQLFAAYDDGGLDNSLEKEIALKLMGLCGLRTAEMLDVTPSDIHEIQDDEGDTHYKLRVRSGKGDKDRDTYVPQRFADLLRTYERAYGIAQDAPFVERDRRTIQRWTNRAAEYVASETQNGDWTNVSCHDLRRSWAMRLLDSGTAPTVVMELGGWENYRTFKDHYLGHHSDATVASEASKAFR